MALVNPVLTQTYNLNTVDSGNALGTDLSNLLENDEGLDARVSALEEADPESTLTTKGDLLGRSATAPARIPAGANGSLLGYDSAQANGVTTYTPAQVVTAGAASVALLIPKTVILSNASGDPDHSITFSAGVTLDSTGTVLIVTAAATKALNASWTAGNGGGLLDTGTIANDTSYYGYVIYNSTTGATGHIASTSATSPSLPSGYTHYARIPSGLLRRATGVNRRFTYRTGWYWWTTLVGDIDTTTLSTTSTNFAMASSAPAIDGALIVLRVVPSSATDRQITIRHPSDTDTEPSASSAPFADIVTGGLTTPNELILSVNGSAQVAARSSGASTTLRAAVKAYRFE
jgi:hypothetical protein